MLYEPSPLVSFSSAKLTSWYKVSYKQSVDLEIIGCKYVNWTQLYQDRVQWCASLIMVMNLGFDDRNFV
jgi:hypothetical protein